MAEDWYLILGLKKGADEKAVRRQYKQLAKKYHPDRYGIDRIPFQKIQEAYSVLGNTERKRKYDALLRKKVESPMFKQSGVTGSGFTREGIPVEPLAASWNHENETGNLSNSFNNSIPPVQTVKEPFFRSRWESTSLRSMNFDNWPYDLYEILRSMMRYF